MVSAPLRDRFGFVGRVRPYDVEALAGIVERSAGLLDIGIDQEAAAEIAGRSRGTPRIANMWLRRVRDFVQASFPERADDVHVDVDVAREALAAFGVDEYGLDRTARELLELLCVQFRGGPAGLTTLAAALGETVDTVSEVLEPHLLRCALITRTPRGRVATAAAYEHLGLPAPPAALVPQDDDGQVPVELP
jgi:Holliday junction DNA helicase RuvB